MSDTGEIPSGAAMTKSQRLAAMEIEKFTIKAKPPKKTPEYILQQANPVERYQLERRDDSDQGIHDITVSLNHNTVVTHKTKLGVDHANSAISKVSDRVEATELDIKELQGTQQATDLVVGQLVERNKILDDHISTIAKVFNWFRAPIGWWLLTLVKIACIGVGYLLIDYIFTKYLGTPLPRSIAPAP
jgi:hypothetical protein